MRFQVYGPYDIGVDKGFHGWIDEEDTKERGLRFCIC